MDKIKRASLRLLAGGLLAALYTPASFAAGSVAMQIEHLVRQAMNEYNSAMEEGDSAAFAKYFASNARYESPLFRYSGRTEFAPHLDAEFKTYKARYQVNKMIVQDAAAALVLTWNAVDRKSGEEIKLDMVGVFEVGSSGQFSSAVFYYDSAKAKGLSSLAK